MGGELNPAPEAAEAGTPPMAPARGGRPDAGGVGAPCTFLFTDVEGHSAMWAEDEGATVGVLERHDATIATVVGEHRGRVVKYEGDGVMAVFDDPVDAVDAARAAQEQLRELEWHGEGLRVRMGLHVGPAFERDGDYLGPSVILAARLCDAAHGGQVVASEPLALLAPDARWQALGEHRFRGVAHAQRVFQLPIDGLPAAFPPLRHVEAGTDRLPRPRTAFVGRQRELDEVLQALTTHQVVTLTSIGGGGKSRLAVEVARAGLDRFVDGADLLDLTAVDEGAALPGALTTMLGLDVAGTSASESLRRASEFLADRRVLLVVDNCEHLLDNVAELVDGLVDACPHLRILATSREPLRVDGEHVVQLPSLDTDSAVALFLDRSPIAVDDDGTVRRICERLDGIPLAIELAAARTSHLGVVELADRLDDRFRLLTGGRRRVARQQTLQATLDWSCNLLDRDERRLLRRLSAFAGSFPLEWVEGLEEPDPDGVVDALGSLVDRSMVVHDHESGRYRLLETVRLYAGQLLVDAGEAHEVRSRHRDVMVGVLRRHPLEATMLASSTSRALAASYPDLRAAVEWSIGNGEWEVAADLVHRLPGVAALADRPDVTEWVDEVLRHLGGDTDLAFRCMAAGVIAHSFESERPDADGGDPSPPRTLRRLAAVERRARERDDGLATLTLMGVALYYAGIGLGAGDAGILGASEACRQEAIARAELDPPTAWRSYALGIGGILALADDVVRATELLRLASGRDGGFANPEYLAAFALALQMQGDPDALTCATAARGRAMTGYGLFTALTAEVLALADDGDVDAARRELAEAAPDVAKVGPMLRSSYVITAAGVALATGEPDRASRWLGAASGLGDTFTTPTAFVLYGRFVSEVRAALSADHARRLRGEGRAIGLDGACAEILRW